MKANIFFVSIILSGLAYGGQDCSKITQQLSCQSYYFKANSTAVKPGIEKQTSTNFVLQSDGDEAESYCSASLNLNDSVYGLNAEVVANDRGGMMISLHLNGDNASSMSVFNAKLGEESIAALQLSKPLDGVGADGGYKIYRMTVSCKIK